MSQKRLSIVDAGARPRSIRTRSALVPLLNTVFGASWIGQQRFTSTPEIDALHAALQVGPDAHVLDLGSGLGGPAIHLAQHTGCQVTGIDSAVEHVHHAQAAAEAAGVAERVRFVAGNAIEADFATGAFDAIVSQDVFITIEDKAQLLACCQRWLRPSGRLATTLVVDLGGLQGEADRPDLLAWPIPTAHEYRILAEQAGLRILAIDDLTRSFREIGARWRGALLVWEQALVPAIGYENWTVLHATIGRLAEWATQGLLGHIRLVAAREPKTSASTIAGSRACGCP